MAENDHVLAVAKLVDELRKAGGTPSEADLNRLAAQVGSGFNARQEEVAVLRLSPDEQTLSFLFPARLSVLGTIPITAAQAMSVRTLRERLGEIDNNFSTCRHLTVFEAVDLSAEEKAVPIQKIMSSPMLVEGKAVGVIQVSRKGHPGDPVGPDFAPADLERLGALGTVIGKYILELPAPPPHRPRTPAKPK